MLAPDGRFYLLLTDVFCGEIDSETFLSDLKLIGSISVGKESQDHT